MGGGDPGGAGDCAAVFGLKEPAAAITHKRTNPITRANLRLLGRGYWWVVGIGAVFTLARFSEAFLVLKAQQGGTPLALIPLVMVAMNLVYACSAYPFGKLSDRMSHEGLLKAGLLVLIAADLVLALSDHWGGGAVWRGAVGRAHGHDAGTLAAMVAHTAPAHLRGTAFGMFNLISGVALLLASLGLEPCGSCSVPPPPSTPGAHLRGDAGRHNWRRSANGGEGGGAQRRHSVYAGCA
ncbi:MFS transporter [Serratia ureilytica]